MSYRIPTKGERMHEPLSEGEKKRIIELKLSGKCSQIEIARMFRVHAQTVRLVLREAGIGRYAELTPELEAEAVRLLQTQSVPKVAKQLRLSSSKVREIRDNHGIDPKRYAEICKLSPEKRKEIEKAAREHTDYCLNVAEKLGVHPQSVRKYAHQVLGSGRFRPGNRVEPMTSNFPQNSVITAMTKQIEQNLNFAALDECDDDAKLSVFDEPNALHVLDERAALFMTDLAVQTSFDGKMPDTEWLAGCMSEKFLEYIPANIWNKLAQGDQRLLRTSVHIQFLTAAEALRVSVAHRNDVAN